MLYLQLLNDLREAESEEEQNRAKQEAAESKRLAEKFEDHAAQERRHVQQQKVSVVVPLLTFLLGMIADHFSEIISLVASLFS